MSDDDSELIEALKKVVERQEEHFSIYRDLLVKSEQRTDTTNGMVDRLITTIGKTKQEREEAILTCEKRLASIRESYEARIAENNKTIEHLRQRLMKSESRCDALQNQNNSLIDQIKWLDKQIAKLEDNQIALVNNHLLHQAQSQTQVTVGDFKSAKK